MKKEVAECARNKTYRKSFYNQHKKKFETYCTYYFPSNQQEPYECPLLGEVIMVKKVSAPGMFHWVRYFSCQK